MPVGDLRPAVKRRLAARLKRETGAIPVRTRRCEWGRRPQDATVPQEFASKRHGKARPGGWSTSQKTCRWGVQESEVMAKPRTDAVW